MRSTSPLFVFFTGKIYFLSNHSTHLIQTSYTIWNILSMEISNFFLLFGERRKLVSVFYIAISWNPMVIISYQKVVSCGWSKWMNRTEVFLVVLTVWATYLWGSICIRNIMEHFGVAYYLDVCNLMSTCIYLLSVGSRCSHSSTRSRRPRCWPSTEKSPSRWVLSTPNQPSFRSPSQRLVSGTSCFCREWKTSPAFHTFTTPLVQYSGIPLFKASTKNGLGRVGFWSGVHLHWNGNGEISQKLFKGRWSCIMAFTVSIFSMRG